MSFRSTPLFAGDLYDTALRLAQEDVSKINVASDGMASSNWQQMLALGRAMIAKPKLLLVDELSLGLAPLIVRDIYKQLLVIGETLGTAMLVVEQNANLALSFAQSAYLLKQGRVVLSGSAAEVAANPLMKISYLGEAKAAGESIP